MRAVVLACLAVAGEARADIDVHLDVDRPPQVRATIGGIRAMPADQFSLTAEDGTTAKPLRVEAASEPIAIALVYSGWEAWIGDDDLGVTPSLPGALKRLIVALDEQPLARNQPPGSKLVAVAYSQGAYVKVPLGDLTAFHGGALGNQFDYRDKIANDLAEGVTRGLAELEQSALPRKALLVIGDGTDTDVAKAGPALAQLARRAAAAHVSVEAIVLRSPMSSERDIIGELVADPIRIDSAEGLRAALTRAAGRFEDRRIAVVFDGTDLTIQPGTTYRVGVGSETIPVRYDPPAGWTPPPPDEPAWWKAPWRWAVVGGGVAVLAVLLVLLLRIRSAAQRPT